MKRLCYFVFLLFSISFLSVIKVDEVAASSPQIFPEDAIINENNIKIPVAIKNNPGLMGYIINLEYDNNIIINSIEAGSISGLGLFDNNIGVNDKGIAYVLWSNSAEIKQDGVLFYINISIGELNERTRIAITYSPKDTFNEKYEEIKLECKDIFLSENKQGVVVKATDKEPDMPSEKDMTGNKKLTISDDEQTDFAKKTNKDKSEVKDKSTDKSNVEKDKLIDNGKTDNKESLEGVTHDMSVPSGEIEQNDEQSEHHEANMKDADLDSSAYLEVSASKDKDASYTIIYLFICILIVLFTVIGAVIYRRKRGW